MFTYCSLSLSAPVFPFSSSTTSLRRLFFFSYFPSPLSISCCSGVLYDTSPTHASEFSPPKSPSRLLLLLLHEYTRRTDRKLRHLSSFSSAASPCDLLLDASSTSISCTLGTFLFLNVVTRVQSHRDNRRLYRYLLSSLPPSLPFLLIITFSHCHVLLTALDTLLVATETDESETEKHSHCTLCVCVHPPLCLHSRLQIPLPLCECVCAVASTSLLSKCTCFSLCVALSSNGETCSLDHCQQVSLFRFLFFFIFLCMHLCILFFIEAFPLRATFALQLILRLSREARTAVTRRDDEKNKDDDLTTV